MIDTAERAHVEIESILQRMRELSVQSANDTYADSDRPICRQNFHSYKLKLIVFLLQLIGVVKAYLTAHRCLQQLRTVM